MTIIFVSKYFSLKQVTSFRYQRSISEEHTGIPRIVHFIVGQEKRENTQNQSTSSSSFIFINYLNILAARRQLKPDKLYIHYHTEPNTFWWNQTKQDPDINVTLVKSRLVESIFNKSVDQLAHRADVMRLEILINYGGIYFDTDVLALRSFEPLLSLADVVMANQDDDEKTACSAIVIAKKNATFLRRVYDAYQSFDDSCWDCHSVRLTGQLALIYPNEARLLPTVTFFYPGYYHGDIFFRENDYNFSSNYASHLWNKVFHDELEKLTPEKILARNFTLARMLLHAIGKTKLQKLRKTFAKTSPRHSSNTKQ